MALITNRVQVGHPGVTGTGEMRDAAKRNPDEFLGRCRKLIDEGKMSFRTIDSIQGLYAALRDVPVTVHVDDMYGTRAVTTAAFPVLTGDLVVQAINHSYDAVPTIGGMLVEEMRDPNKNTWVSLINPAQIDNDFTVKEGDPFPKMTAAEEPMMIPSRRTGRQISITRELIDENRVGDITRQIDAVGEWAAEDIEAWTLRKVCDTDSDVYRPNGTAEALYSASARARTGSSGNLKTSNALTDFTDLENVRSLLTAMKSPLGYRVSMRYPLDLLVPDALVYKAMRLIQSPFVAEQTTLLYVQSMNEWSKGGKFGTRIISSPKLDDLSTTSWWMGNFNRQYVRKWKFDIEYVTLGENTQEYLNSRIAFMSRVAFDCTVGAVDYIHVVKSTA